MTWDPVEAIYRMIDQRIQTLRERQRATSAKDPYWMEIEYACSQLRQLRKSIDEAEETT